MDPQSSRPVESLSGLIERVTFYNEENGFAVLKVKARGQREDGMVVGSVPAVNPGEWLTAEGTWVRDREFGLQFRASSLASTAPTSREGIEKYLGSGLVKGIGPTYAKKLVKRFGDQIFDIIENFSVRLEEVEGIGPMRRRRIKQAWGEQKVIREIMVFLHSHGVSTSRAVRIYKKYGEKAIEIVREDPYTLARDIPGIGFKTADQVAQKIGIPHDSVLRASAGLEHILAEAAGQGHCALPIAILKEQAAKLLGVGAELVDSAMQRALINKLLVREDIAGEEFAFPPNLQKAEVLITSRMRQLASTPSNLPRVDADRALVWYHSKSGKELAPTQQQALKAALSHRALVITGGPGVGKTTLLNAVLMILRAKEVRCQLCAPTGRAAKRLSEATGLEAKTIHRLLEVDPGKGGFTRNEKRPLSCDLLVVDEVSMVDVLLMSALLRALPSHASVLLVGDVDQLPSVGPGTVLRDLIDSRILPVARLTEVFRQAAGSKIITNAHRINEGLLPESVGQQSSSDFYFVEREEPARILDTLLQLVRDRIPGRFGLNPLKDVQVLSPMNRSLLGVRELNVRLQSALNPPRSDEQSVEKFGWQFRLRDKVIQTENNYEKEVFNGDIGQVSAIDPVEREVRVRFDDREVLYDFGELDEISLAYAITIHKSQGSEFPAVVIPVSTQHYLMLQRNLLYTGVTRGKQLTCWSGRRKPWQLPFEIIGPKSVFPASFTGCKVCRGDSSQRLEFHHAPQTAQLSMPLNVLSLKSHVLDDGPPVRTPPQPAQPQRGEA